MGGVLPAHNGTPEFYVWAEADPRAAPLQKIQMVKGWLQDGQTRERVIDIACADSLNPDSATGYCPDNEASVNLSDCSYSPDLGSRSLNTYWSDPEFDAEQAAFYYVRVLENPSCRWSTYDALRLGIEPTKLAPATIQERAWSSPIWHRPAR